MIRSQTQRAEPLGPSGCDHILQGLCWKPWSLIMDTFNLEITWRISICYSLSESCGCFQKYWYPKMDGLFHGKPYEQMDDLGGLGPTPIFGSNTHVQVCVTTVTWQRHIYQVLQWQMDVKAHQPIHDHSGLMKPTFQIAFRCKAEMISGKSMYQLPMARLRFPVSCKFNSSCRTKNPESPVRNSKRFSWNTLIQVHARFIPCSWWLSRHTPKNQLSKYSR